MITVSDILAFVESVAPPSYQMSWDNTGLLCGRKDKEVRTVLVALDPFTSVCQEAVQLGADLLVTHHPLIFQPVTSVTDQTTVGKAVMTLIRNDIAPSMHTPIWTAHREVSMIFWPSGWVLRIFLSLAASICCGQVATIALCRIF